MRPGRGSRRYVPKTQYVDLQRRHAAAEVELKDLREVHKQLRHELDRERGMFDFECPCCGGFAGTGEVSDSQELHCGCAGWFSVDSESEPYPIIGDDPCPPEAGCNLDPFSECVGNLEAEIVRLRAGLDAIVTRESPTSDACRIASATLAESTKGVREEDR